MAKLKNYRLVNSEGVDIVVVKNSAITLATLTEEQAKFLFDNGSRYVQKVEKVKVLSQPEKDLV